MFIFKIHNTKPDEVMKQKSEEDYLNWRELRHLYYSRLHEEFKLY